MSSLTANLGAVIMLGGGGDSEQEQIVLAAQRACILDLITLLHDYEISQIILASPDVAWLPPDLATSVQCDIDQADQTFHFGRRLADLIERYALTSVLYLGGGSTPLLDASLVDMMLNLVQRANQSDSKAIPSHIVLTNNLHSSDWLVVSNAADAVPILLEAERDNSVAWMLKESGEYEVRVLAGVRPATSFDIDTPSDIALLAAHPQLSPLLRHRIESLPLGSVPVTQILNVLRGEGNTVAILGRVSPLAWNALNKAARCWTRVVAEERGMVASGRMERGEVQSLLKPWVDAIGWPRFFDNLAQMADAVLFDNRVLWSAYGHMPTAADRFASDLFWVGAIQDSWLRDFTAAALAAPVPIIMGGHSIVSGGLYVLSEILAGG